MKKRVKYTATNKTAKQNQGAWEEVSNKDRRIRQAVLVIHGMGEQHPMDTLRSFVDAVLVDEDAKGCIYRSKPDSMNESFETRCLQAPRNRKLYRPLTDFYEYYWAHHMKESKYIQVLGWLLGLIIRSPKMIPHTLRQVYFVSWGLIFFAATCWMWGLLAGTGPHSFLGRMWEQKWLFVSGSVTFLAQWIGSRYILGYMADASQYFKPSPDNIESRNLIRSEGIKLLRNLHESGKYNRIIVVGHSLGAVIGYDIIRNLWVDLRKPSIPYPQKQPKLKAFEQETNILKENKITPAKIEAYQQCQHSLWKEFRKLGIPWLVTDFVTLGAPLTYAQLLMADNPDDFTRKKAQYEYPCCPPVEGEKPYYRQQYRLVRENESVIRNVFVPHHGAPFCCIRWTNLYFPYRHLIHGDLIGGPLNGVFGKGIRDIAVGTHTNNYLERTLVSHTRYWTESSKGKRISTDFDINPSLETLRKALRLDFLRSKR